jgi:cyclic beta-1,2-glucan synthetase
VRGAPGLWAYSISGDLPIVLVRIDDEDDRDIVREVLRAHEYWRMKSFAVDLVILNERGASYASELQSSLENLVRANQDRLRQEPHVYHGDIFVLRSDRLSFEDRVLLLTAARVILLSRQGTLAQQMERLEDAQRAAAAAATGPLFGLDVEMGAELMNEDPDARRESRLSAFASRVSDLLLGAPEEEAPERPAPPDRQFFNGLGGFSKDGREYVITLGPGLATPAPWVNVISNPGFGFQVSESGSGYTWSVNSRENQLTPWSNDPVSDPAGEAFYLKDEDSGEVWTPTALPVRQDAAAYTARHGRGYTRFEHFSHGIACELLQFVPLEDPVKISRLRLTNRSKRPRRISLTAYVEWVMGFSRGASAPFIVTERDERTGALLARNPWNTEFSGRVSFLDFAGRQTSWTADRAEFIGRNGALADPAALREKKPLSGRVGAGLDPCAALQTSVLLQPGGRVDLVCFLGQAADRAAAVELIERCRTQAAGARIDAQLGRLTSHWDDVLGTVQVRTPDRAMDVMLNGWLLYQTLACRLWARAGFYQAGGAYGFRDQLQDVMALTVARRDLAREQIVRAAGRQFPEGDVQHWWHPPSGRGVRTRISDDLIWLPYVVTHYLEVTGDESVLDEKIPFLEGPPLAPGKEDAYFAPGLSSEAASLFEHCARTLDRSLTVGAHGLPLMGSGDWNDGMNRVGLEGKGESVWLGWFLHAALWEFAKVAEKRGEVERAERWRLHVHALKAALEREGWDGDWYRRAFFDDGTPLGSASQEECRIDSIAQSWGVLSGAADPARAARAMAAVDEHLVRRRDGLVLLFTPPFDKTAHNPGYIKGYLPGVRENGGQYTHAAVWTVMAFAALGNGDRAMELFNLLNPVNRSGGRAAIQRYKVEPYVMPGDVYSVAPHTGRGGWTWYSGSAGWMYRAGVEWILGFRMRGPALYLDPCIPKAWPRFDMEFRYHSARYHIAVDNPSGVSKGVHSAALDGKSIRAGAPIHLIDDGAAHTIHIVLG